MRDLAVDLRAVRESLASGETTARSAPPAAATGSRAVAIGAAAIVVTAAIVGAWLWTRRAEPVATAEISTSTPVRPAVAVLTFEVISGGADIAWLGKGLPSLLTTGLAQTPDIEVVGPERMSDAARQTGAATLDAVDRSRHADLARRAGARFIVNGTIVQAGADLRIDARVEDLTSGAVRVAVSARGPDPLALADDLSTQIRKGLDVQAVAPRKVAEVTSGSIAAYRDYTAAVEAHYATSRPADAERLYLEAIRQDAGFALAHVGLAYLAEGSGRVQDQRDSLKRAAEHLDRLAERDQLMVRAELARVDERFDEANRLYETVMDRYPDTEASYFWGTYPNWWFGFRPDVRRRIAILERGIKALPYSALLHNAYGYALMDDGRVDEGLRSIETYVKLRPSAANAVDSLAEIQFMAGDLTKAIKTYDQAFDLGHPSGRGRRGWVQAVAGRYDEALTSVLYTAATPSTTANVRRIHVWILSRLGRYREAGKGAVDARTLLENQEDAARAWSFLVDASFALERGECERTPAPIAEAERAAGSLGPAGRRPMLVVADLIAGACDARSGRAAQARARLAHANGIHAAGAPNERWWVAALEGEIALASGDAAGAARSFVAGEPARKMVLNLFSLYAPNSFLANNLVLRDGRARAAVAQGRLDEAIRLYRELLTPGPQSKWTAMLEPRHVLALARLLDKAGQRDAARVLASSLGRVSGGRRP